MRGLWRGDCRAGTVVELRSERVALVSQLR